MSDRRAVVVAALGTAQTLAWASTYYLPAMLATPMSRDLAVSTPTIFGAFSVALVISALIGPYAGLLIDRFGGRPVLIGTNAVFAIGLASLAVVQGPLGLFAAWSILGVGMGAGLYEAAFSTLVRIWGHGARGAITGITLIAGFASTIGWPLTELLDTHFGWRGACVTWAVLHLVLGMPLNALLPRAVMTADKADSQDSSNPDVAADAVPRSTAPLLAFVFAATWFTSTAMASHLPRLLQVSGAGVATAVMVGALVGPAQVLARLAEFGFLRRLHPLLSARIATVMHPLGAACLLVTGPAGAVAFGLLHGGGNGILTIAKGTLPLALFGPTGFGRRQGLLNIPARFAQAGAPWLFGLCMSRWGASALLLTAVLGVLSLAALLALPGISGGGASRSPRL